LTYYDGEPPLDPMYNGGFPFHIDNKPSMNRSLVLLAMLAVSQSRADNLPTVIGESNCLVINPHPVKGERVSWSGGCKDGYASGAGVLQWYLDDKATDRYEGTMQLGRPDGHGRYDLADKAFYEGDFKEGLRDGKGYLRFANGTQYEGDFSRGKRTGEGIQLLINGTRYEGAWKDNLFDGVGTIDYALGGRYQGQWKAGKFDGKGSITYAGGKQHAEGQFSAGLPAGGAQATPAALARYSFSSGNVRFFGSNTSVRDITGGIAPFEKPYDQLNDEQQRAVKSQYPLLAEGDEPPYPLHGLKPIYQWLSDAQAKLLVEGELRLYVLVGADGKPVQVTMIGSPSADMTKFAASVVMRETYKPAMCDGTPCQMVFPFSMHFVTH
jgi:hypothetical protein